MRVYYTPRCSKCRIAKAFLGKNNLKFEIASYITYHNLFFKIDF